MRSFPGRMSQRSEHLTRKADEDLLPLVGAADADAFEVFYERHADAAFALAHRISGSHAAADDICQEAFVNAWRSAERYDARLGSARSWLLTIVHHRAIDHIRRSTRLRERTVDDEGAAARLPAGDDTARLGAGRDRAPRDVGAAGKAAGRAAPGRDARLLLGLLAQRDRRADRHPAGHDQVTDAARPRHAARPSRGRSLGMSDHCTDPRMNELLGSYLLGACPDAEADAVREHLDACAACAREAARARGRSRRPADSRSGRPRAARAQGPRHGAGPRRRGAVRRCAGPRGRPAEPRRREAGRRSHGCRGCARRPVSGSSPHARSRCSSAVP